MSRNEHLFKQDDTVNYLYVVKKGTLQLEKTINKIDKQDSYYASFDNEKFKKIKNCLTDKKILLNTISESEVISELVVPGHCDRHNYSAVCKTSFAVIYALDKNRIKAFPRSVIEIITHTFSLKEKSRIDKFTKDVSLRIKMFEFMKTNPPNKLRLKLPKHDIDNIPKTLQRICSLDKHAQIRRTMTKTMAANLNKANKKDAFLYDIDDRMFVTSDKNFTNTVKFRTQCNFQPMKTLAMSSRANLNSCDKKSSSAFRITKKELITVREKTINFKGIKISFKRC